MLALFIIIPPIYAQELDPLQEANLAFSYQHPESMSESFAQLESMAQQQEEVRVIIALDIPIAMEGEMEGPQVIQSQRQMIQSAQQDIMEQLSAANALSPDTYQFKHIPYISTTVNLDSLNVLQSSLMVASIMQDVAVPPLLYQSNSIIGADKVWSESFEDVGYTGAGQQIVILDTGVDKNHSFLAGKIVSEACYSSTVPSESSTSLCPGGVQESTETDSGLPCPSSIAGCDHGTHVAGIAAGGTFLYVGNEYHGVAPDAQIIPMKVFSQFNNPSSCFFQAPCVLSYTSDQMKALERVF
ncbi:MAG: S8 family serine peptidase, partial [Nitrosopumilus sp.]|nr:S8 family serine peptidase [Nitrosopumilus sp.]